MKIIQNIVVPIILYGNENWTLKHCDKNGLRTAEMKYLQCTAGYTLLGHKRNEEILEKLHVKSLEEKTLYIQTQLVPTRP
jgi:hypothetical protein